MMAGSPESILPRTTGSGDATVYAHFWRAVDGMVAQVRHEECEREGKAIAARIRAKREEYDLPEKDADLYNRGVLYGMSVAAKIAAGEVVR
jgi:hypothetical protein